MDRSQGEEVPHTLHDSFIDFVDAIVVFAQDRLIAYTFNLPDVRQDSALPLCQLKQKLVDAHGVVGDILLPGIHPVPGDGVAIAKDCVITGAYPLHLAGGKNGTGRHFIELEF